jgi:hypothetical protein
MVVILLAATGCLGGIVGGKGLGKQTVTVKHYPSCYYPGG